ncbi:hypothetical protein HGRIS_014980 [Hohenbuehelia grisea]|uniref:Uncharacterized protein n=1 Tax=Hohenbuehelia grisea TaxID=104357 RepID=A0ABR3JV06_9AGAR
MSSSTDTTGSSSIYRINPLKGSENYSVWKMKLIDILTDLGLIEYADGTAKPPEQSATDAAKQEFTRKDRQALSTIRLRVADKLLVYIAGSTSANSAWKILGNMFESRGPIGIVMARRKFFRAHCDDDTSIEEHIRLMRTYQEELHSLGQKIEEEEFSITLLTSLPESWNSFISAIDTSALKSSTTLIARILEEDRRLKAKTETDTALANPNIIPTSFVIIATRRDTLHQSAAQIRRTQATTAATVGIANSKRSVSPERITPKTAMTNSHFPRSTRKISHAHSFPQRHT